MTTMAFPKPVKSFIAITCLLFAVVVKAQQHDDKQELRAKFFHQVLSDFKDLRECMEQEEGGVRKAQENMNVEELDLNNDGVKEYEVEMSGPCACGMVNCSIYIYRKTGQGLSPFSMMLPDLVLSC